MKRKFGNNYEQKPEIMLQIHLRDDSSNPVFFKQSLKQTKVTKQSCVEFFLLYYLLIFLF